MKSHVMSEGEHHAQEACGQEYLLTPGELTANRQESVPSRPLPSVSVIIPARNAEATIEQALDSVQFQDYEGPVEVIVADGSETSHTSQAIRRHSMDVRLVPNPEQTIGFGINAAARAATGDILVRCDAHSFFPPGYLRRVVEALQRTGAANVGGRQLAVGNTFFERAVAVAMTTALGSGNARHRVGGAEGPVDTAYLGAFYRETFEEMGGLDPSFLRNQDYEFNWRLRAYGKTVWFDPHLTVFYLPRGTLWGLARQYFHYGRWKPTVLRWHPRSLRVRHLAAPALVLCLATLLFLVLTGTPWTAVALLAYPLILVVWSLWVGVRCRTPAALFVPVVLATMHLSWGIGFFLPARYPAYEGRIPASCNGLIGSKGGYIRT